MSDLVRELYLRHKVCKLVYAEGVVAKLDSLLHNQDFQDNMVQKGFHTENWYDVRIDGVKEATENWGRNNLLECKIQLVGRDYLLTISFQKQGYMP